VCNHFLAMARRYELKARAERQRQTRRRIVEAAIELHAIQGPARTTLSEVARRAGVERHTLYRHFPNERALGVACSGLYAERNPLPDPGAWRTLRGADRVRQGLVELYAFFERNEPMLSRVTRDAEYDELTRELAEMRFGEHLRQIRRTLAQALPRRKGARAVLDVALDFSTWRRLRASGLSSDEAADAMVRALRCQ
jgi:AcrR family transcriptional regulator